MLQRYSEPLYPTLTCFEAEGRVDVLTGLVEREVDVVEVAEDEAGQPAARYQSTHPTSHRLKLTTTKRKRVNRAASAERAAGVTDETDKEVKVKENEVRGQI